jgi:NADH-quinone oxidoreductase subunit M
LLGSFIAGCVPDHRTRLIRVIALTASSLSLGLSCSLLFFFDALSPALQLGERDVWNPSMGSFYALGVDGFSLPMILLSSLLALVAVLASDSVKKGIKGYHIGLLALESGMLGVFMAQDWALFYVFWELTLIPLFFLIDLWGGTHRHRASLNFVLYTMGGSVFMVLGLLAVYTASEHNSTAMDAMATVARTLPKDTQIFIFAGLLVGFGVKMPVVPLHGWLPLAHMEAPGPVNVLLSGASIKMGAYGLIRAVEMLPEATLLMQPWLASLALISIVYGGLIAWRQTDLKAMIAYASISHMGIVLLGIAALNTAGLAGAVLQMMAHGLVAGALFLLVGLLYERTRTRNIGDYSSLVRSMPRCAGFMTLALLASVGLPGSVGFVAELYTLIGGFQSFGWWALLLSAGLLIGAAYGFRTIGGLFTGPVRPAMLAVPDLRPLEVVAAGLLMTAIVGFGVHPAPSLNVLNASVMRLSAIF